MSGEDLKAQARQVAEALEAKRSEASTAWAEFDTARKSAVQEGVNFAENRDAFEKLDSLGKKHDVIAEEIKQLEYTHSRLLGMAGGKAAPQVPSQRGGEDERPGRGWGKRYTGTDEYREIKSVVEQSGAAIGTTRPVKVADRAEVKAVLTGTVGTGAAGEGGSALFIDRQPGIHGIPQAPLNILDLITVGETDERTVSWIVESTFNNNAAETAENALKPESDFGLLEKTATVRDIAHWTKVTRQMLRDVAALETYIDSRLAYGVRRRLQKQIVAGSGAGVNLLGLYNQSGTAQVSKGSNPLVEVIHNAITQVRLGYFDDPTAVLIHPSDWETIRLFKAGDGSYYYGGPAGVGPQTVWGLPVVVSVDAPVGFPMVANFREATLWVREGLTIASTDSNEDDFKYNRVMIRAEMAAAFGVIEPKAFAEIVA